MTENYEFNYDLQLKIITVGDAGVRKTSLFNQEVYG